MKEIRSSEIRADSTQDQNNVLVGTPIVFDKPTLINDKFGSYIEIIKRSAIDPEILNDTALLYNHDVNQIPLARSPETMKLEKTTTEINMRAALPDTTTGKEVYSAVKRRDIKGMSFAFQVPKGGDEFNPETNTRTINRIEKLYEVSVTPFPAYAETSVEARSGAMCKRNIQAQKAKAKVNKILGSQLKNKVDQILKGSK